MFKKIWYLIFNKKEKIMPTQKNETISDSTHVLVKQQTVEIARLKGRIGEIVDELGIVKKDLSIFKEKLSEDLTKIVGKINEQGG
tara:strand:+ start:494 stop:748 length:255 start_codon:yes stop_codon:yes gene_type:complete